jgi:hypothetical protein
MSDTDKIAMKEIAGEMAKAGLPGLMLIAGDGGSYTIHLTEYWDGQGETISRYKISNGCLGDQVSLLRRLQAARAFRHCSLLLSLVSRISESNSVFYGHGDNYMRSWFVLSISSH